MTGKAIPSPVGETSPHTPPSPCPYCGDSDLEVYRDGSRWIDPWMVICPCYDGAPDSPNRYLYGSGPSEAEAIEDWNEKVRDWK